MLFVIVMVMYDDVYQVVCLDCDMVIMLLLSCMFTMFKHIELMT